MIPRNTILLRKAIAASAIATALVLVVACFTSLEQPTDDTDSEIEDSGTGLVNHIAMPTEVPDSDVESGRVVRLTRTANTEKDPVWSPSGDKIAFECFSDGQVRNRLFASYLSPGDICVTNSDGSARVQLTDDQGDDADPAWSPDGSKIAFASLRDGKSDIYVMNADGSSLRQVTDDEYTDSGPSWSPDGTRVVYASYREANSEIVIVNTDGTAPTQITDGLYYDEKPAWSPDGERIAFVSSRSHQSGIYLMNTDGTDQAWLHFGGSPAWSPDGKTIAFTLTLRNSEVHTINIDGSGLSRLTYRDLDDSNPHWSPDGSKLVFESDLVGNSEIYALVDLNTHYQRLTDNAHADSYPVWSPDGTRIVFVSDRDGDDELYIMNADGSGVTQLTYNGYADSEPTWSPDGNRIAYVSSPNERRYDVFIINDDGTGIGKLTPYDEVGAFRYNGAPSWSPDGTRITFVSYLLDIRDPYGSQRHVMTADGTHQVTLDVGNCPSRESSWSPDGTRIAFSCGDSHLHLLNPLDGIKSSFAACGYGVSVSSPTWSPDGTRIAFSCGGPAPDRLFAINVNDGDITRLSFAHYYYDIQPAWSPDGTKLAFATNRDGDYEIYILDLARAPLAR